MRNIIMLEANSVTGGCTCDAKKGTFENGNSSLAECASECTKFYNNVSKPHDGRFYTCVAGIGAAVIAGAYLLSKMKGEVHFNLGGIHFSLGGISFGGGAVGGLGGGLGGGAIGVPGGK